nr:hypothetical protein [Tanacetum cinerariifolium]
MEKSRCKEIDLTSLADTFKLQGNKAVESKLYPKVIELYTVAIILHGDNAIYYYNRATAYTHSSQDAEAIINCQKAITINPKYIKAYCRLGYIYFAQGKYTEALEKGYGIAEHKVWQQREERGQPPQNVVSSLLALANSPSFVHPSRTPTSARFGSALNIETLRENPVNETVKGFGPGCIFTLTAIAK